jgi:hypothetical protein
MEFAKTLYIYGPFALLALLVFVMEGKARRQLKESHASNSVRISIYVAVWLAIFVCGAITVWIWINLNVPGSEQVIRGRLIGLQRSEEFRSRKEMFVRKVYDKKDCDFAWRIISPKKLDPGYTVDLWVDLSTPDHEDPDADTPYELPISSDFYADNKELLLDYDRRAHQLKLRTSDGWTVLKKVGAMVNLSDHSPSWWDLSLNWLMPSSLAQTSNLQSILQRLESNDAIVRVDARNEIAQMGQAAVPFIEEILNDQKSSYRLRLGVLVALNKMPSVQLSGSASCVILKATQDSDTTLRDEANHYISSHGKPKCMQPTCNSKLEIRGIRGFTVANQPVYVYLAGISAGDLADVYVISSWNKIWKTRDTRGKLPKSVFQKGIRSLAPADDQLVAETYYRRKLKSGESFDSYSPGSSKLQVTVKETHYFKEWACLFVSQ